MILVAVSRSTFRSVRKSGRLRVEECPELESVISNWLETDRGLRYQQAADLRTDLERTPQLRNVVVSRLLSALGPFGAHIESVGVRLQTSTGHSQPDTSICDAAVSLRPSGEVRARAEEVTMDGAITRASAGIRAAVEREVYRLQAARRASYAADAGPDVLELVLRGNQISQQQREWFERPKTTCGPRAYGSTGGLRGVR